MTEPDLTPIQELIMNQLAARHRLGHTMWPFSTKISKHLRALEGLGLINTKSGVVQGTMEAWFTNLGKSHYLSPTYVAPIFDEHTKRTESRILRAHALWLRAQGDKSHDPAEQSHYYHAALLAKERADQIQKEG